MTDEKIAERLRPGKLRQDGMKVILTQLARSTAGSGERRERGIGGLQAVMHRSMVRQPVASSQ
jgi:hypothetical protein